MAWANSNGSFNNYDMDSAEGAVAKKLRVRDTTTPPAAQTYRAEIAERVTGSEANALKVVGNVELAEFRNGTDNLAGSLTVEPAGLYINSRDPQQIPGGDPAVHLGWHGDNDTGNYVFIGGKEIGMGPGQSPISGNKVTMAAPVLIPGGIGSTEGDLKVVERDQEGHILGGRIVARHLDAPLTSPPIDPVALSVGAINASRVDIARSGVQTEVAGSLKVDQTLELRGNVDCYGVLATRGEGINTNGGYLYAGTGTVTAGDVNASGSISGVDVHAEGTLSGTVLGVTGNASFGGGISSAALTASGQLRGGSLATTGAITGGHLSLNGGGDIGGRLAVNDTVQISAEAVLYPALQVAQTQEHAEHPAVSISTNAQGDPSATAALQIDGPQAMYVAGNCLFKDRVDLNGMVSHQNEVAMNGNRVIMGGDGHTLVELRFEEHGRFEVWIDGRRSFYVDETGGHNG
jgi:hypothetical protein